MHLENQNTLNEDYLDEFDIVMQNNLCPKITYFKAINQSCENFISGSLTNGLHVVTVRYFETLRNNLNLYQVNKLANNDTIIKQMYNLDSYNELCKYTVPPPNNYPIDVIQNFVTQKFMREMVSTLSTTIQDEFSYRIQRKIVIFIIFVIKILVVYIIVWLPFLNNLNLQIYKTKLMLMIIPLEVLLKIKNVAKVLQSQNFINHGKKQGQGSGGPKRKAPKIT
jgi:hypothetical protein